MEPLRIITPFYNAAETLERTVVSLGVIEAANRKRTTVIGVDDGSTDQSASIFERTISKIEGIEHALIRKTNGGSGSARNIALNTFTAGWCLFLDADDELLADPFPVLDQNEGRSSLLFAVAYCRKGGSSRVVRPVTFGLGSVPAIFTALNPLQTLSIIFERSLLSNLFDEGLLYLEDWHFWAVNPGLFANCVRYPRICLGRVHISGRNKTSDQYQNGAYRIRAAEQIADYWGGQLGNKETNNLSIQRTIGNIQMGRRKGYGAFLRIPASLSLYLKLVVYTFFFPLYRLFGFYTARSQRRGATGL
jgi:glycosyltransferase involved in cell wall biosynthesis